MRYGCQAEEKGQIRALKKHSPYLAGIINSAQALGLENVALMQILLTLNDVVG